MSLTSGDAVKVNVTVNTGHVDYVNGVATNTANVLGSPKNPEWTVKDGEDDLEYQIRRALEQTLAGWTTTMLENMAEAGRRGELKFHIYFAVLDALKRREGTNRESRLPF